MNPLLSWSAIALAFVQFFLGTPANAADSSGERLATSTESGSVVRELARRRTGALAEAVVEDIATASSMATLGKTNYEEDAQKRSWSSYCGEARRLAEDGEFRLAIRAASKALWLGSSSGSTVAIAFAARDLAVTYQFASDLPNATAWATAALKYADQISTLDSRIDVDKEIRFEALKILGDFELREHRLDAALRRYSEARSKLPWVGSGVDKDRIDVAISRALTQMEKFADAEKLLTRIATSTSRVAVSAQRALADIALARRDWAGAIAMIDQSSLDKASDRYEAAWGYIQLARAHRAIGNVDSARERAKRAIDIAHALGARFYSEEIKLSLNSSLQDVYDQAVEILFSLGSIDMALAASDASRQRLLRDMMRRKHDAATDRVSWNVLQDIKSRVTEHEVVIVFHVGQHRTFVWVITQSNLQSRTLSLGKEEVTQGVSRVLTSIRSVSSDVRDVASQAYSDFVLPLLSGLTLDAESKVILVPHGPLHELPFQALRTKSGSSGRWWLQDVHSVRYLLSPSDYRVQTDGPSNERYLLALGNPNLFSQSLDLPGAEMEVVEVARNFASATTRVRSDATRAALLNEVNRAEVLHLATHGVFDVLDPGRSALLLSGVGRIDRVDAIALAGVSLGHTRLVTLSACESGRLGITRGEDSLGFQAALAQAGATRFLVSMWSVDDGATQRLMAETYRRRQSVGEAVALQHAMRMLSSQPESEHPYYWAAFRLVTR